MTEHQRKYARKDRDDKQIALYGSLPLVIGDPDDDDRLAIRWGAVLLAACLGAVLWIAVMAVIDCILYR